MAKTEALSEDEFNEWLNSFPTQQIMKALRNQAFTVKIDTLNKLWDQGDEQNAQTAIFIKEAAKQYCEAVTDFVDITYDDYHAYLTAKVGVEAN